MNGALVGGASRHLPDELTSEIFLNCLEPDDIGCITASSTSAPLLLSSVCRHWRRICLSTPQLWTGINLQDLTTDGLFAVDRKTLLNLLDLWISRSGSCPISIKFSYTVLSDVERGGMMLFLPEQNEDSTYFRDMQALIDKLLSCQHRWRALDMTVLDLSTVERLLRAISVNPASPLLQHLSISTQYLGIFGEIRTYNLALSSQLRTIRILSPLIVPESNGIQFDRLKELDLKYCSSIAGCLQWIDMAPNLETLKVRFFTAEVESLVNETRVRRLEKLSNLSISSFSSDSDPAAFISLLELPALTDLFVDTNDFFELQSWTCIRDLLSRSRPHALEALTLLGTPMSPEVILECLLMSPKLNYLRLSDINDDVLDKLSASTARYPQLEPPLCPVLEVLEIAELEDCSSASLINLAHSRCRIQNDDSPESAVTDTASFSFPASRTTNQYRTLETIIIPYDPDYVFISHPDVIQCVENGMNVVHRAPAFEILPPSRISEHLRQLQ